MGFLWFGNKKKKNEKAVVTEPATNEQETPVAAKPDVVKSDTEVKPTVQDKPEEVKATVQAKPAVVKRTPKKSQVKTAPMTDDAEKKTLMGKFFVRKTDNDRYVFSLRASNGENVATSGAYISKSSLEIGIASMAKNAPIANVEDQTLVKVKEVSNPKFEIYLDKANEYRFRLKARNGEIIAVSQGYSGKSACKNGIESVRKNASAPVVYEE